MQLGSNHTIEEGAPSATALRVAVLRALHQTIDSPPVFIDPLAERILGPDARTLLDRYRANAHETAHLRATLAARGVFAATVIAEAIEHGVRQYVILGAGLDTFAYRHPCSDFRVFEVDRSGAQAWKQKVLRRAKIELPSNLTYVAADFECDDVFAALATVDFEPSQPTVFVMLGVSFYVDRERLLSLLGRIGSASAPGSDIVFDYSEPLDRAPQDVSARYQRASARVAAGGEPWITFFTPTDIENVLRSCGFADASDLDAAAQNKCWFAGRTDGLAAAPLAHLVRARTCGASTPTE